MGFRDRFDEVGHLTAAALAKGREAVAGAAQSVAGDGVGGSGDWLHAALENLEPPPAPLTEPWGLSLATLMRGSRDLPWAADKALGHLDRFGSVRIGPDEVGFDDFDVAWDNVVEVQTSTVVDHLSSRAIEHEVERLRAFLPPFPYRARVVRAVTQGLMTLSLAVLDRTLEQGPAARPIVSGLVHSRRFGRKHEVAAGVSTSVIFAGLPAVNDLLAETARSHGVRLVEPPQGTGSAVVRAHAVRAEIDLLLARRHRLEESVED